MKIREVIAFIKTKVTKLNKKQFYVLWISLTLLVPLSFTLYVRMKDYKGLCREYTNEKVFIGLANAKSSSYEEDRTIDKELEQLNKLEGKKEIDKRKTIYTLLTIFCLISFTLLGLVFLNKDKQITEEKKSP